VRDAIQSIYVHHFLLSFEQSPNMIECDISSFHFNQPTNDEYDVTSDQPTNDEHKLTSDDMVMRG